MDNSVGDISHEDICEDKGHSWDDTDTGRECDRCGKVEAE